MILWIFSLFGLLAVAGLPTQPLKRDAPRLGGVNLAGCDFGILTDGSSGRYVCPDTYQLSYFASKGANMFRIPVGWQYLTAHDETSTSLNATFFDMYDNLVQTALAVGAYVMIDVHNYARWDGGIIGQGGPTNADFNNLWALLASLYKDDSKVIFGIMNEPHSVPDNTLWAATVQEAVNAIREAGATTQMIAIPGNGWAHPDSWLDGSNAPLLDVTDPAAADKSLLILDVHKYLDSDGSGKSTECTTDGLNAFQDFQAFLATNGRKAIISEIGGGNTESCISDLGASLKYIAENTGQYLGFAVWAGGSFDSTYELSVSPQNGQCNDLFTQAIQPYLPGSSGAVSNTSTTTQYSSPTSVSGLSSASSEVPVTSYASATTSNPPVTSTSSSSSNTLSTATTSSTGSTNTDGASPSMVSTSFSSSDTLSTATTSSTGSTTTDGEDPSVTFTSALSSNTLFTSTTSSTGSTTTDGANLQTYTGALGGITAPAVYTAPNGKFTTNGLLYNFLIDALDGSCYVQMGSCQQAANCGGNQGDLTVANCNGQQIQACLDSATASAGGQ